MGQVTHNLSNPNDGFGDALREAFDNQNAMNTELYDTKVDEVAGKGLSENDFTNALKDKLVNIDTDAQINVQADWFQEDDTQDDFIKNKPDYLNAIGSFLYADLATQTTPLNGIANVEKNLTNDIDGANTDLSNSPYGVSTTWNSATNRLDFTQLSIGDVVDLKTSLSVTTTVANQNIQVYARLGLGTTSEKDFLIGSTLRTTAGLFIFEEELKLVISKEDYITSIGEIYLFSESNSTIKVNEFEFVVTRKNVNITAFTGLTDLSATRTPTNVTIESSTGTPALIGLGNGTLAGFSLNDYTTAEKVKLATLTDSKTYNTYFINTATGNNATGVFEDASKPFAGIDYVTALGSYAGGVFELQNAGTFVINNVLPNFDVAIRSSKACTLDFSSNSNTNIIPTASTTKNYEINLPFGIVRNEKSGASGSCFNSLGTGNIIFKAKELYSNQSNNFINNFASTIFEVKKVSGRTSVLATPESSTSRNCKDINIEQFVCLASNSCFISEILNPASINIGLISGTGSYRFAGGKYTIGDITTTGTCNTAGVFLHIDFVNTRITSSGGINLGSSGSSTSSLIFSGKITSSPLVFGTAATNVLFNSNSIKFINFSANFGTGTYNQNHGNVIFENCSIKSTNSPITLGGSATYNSSVEIKNSTFEVVNAVPLVTGGASSGDTLKIAGVSTNATMLSDQNGTGVTVTVIGKNSVADGVDSKDAVNKGQLDSASGSAGSYTATGTATTTFTVTIGTTQADALYKVTASPSNALSAVMFYINNKTTTTFDVVFVTGLTGAVAFDWILKP